DNTPPVFIVGTVEVQHEGFHEPFPFNVDPETWEGDLPDGLTVPRAGLEDRILVTVTLDGEAGEDWEEEGLEIVLGDLDLTFSDEENAFTTTLDSNHSASEGLRTLTATVYDRAGNGAELLEAPNHSPQWVLIDVTPPQLQVTQVFVEQDPTVPALEVGTVTEQTGGGWLGIGGTYALVTHFNEPVRSRPSVLGSEGAETPGKELVLDLGEEESEVPGEGASATSWSHGIIVHTDEANPDQMGILTTNGALFGADTGQVFLWASFVDNAGNQVESADVGRTIKLDVHPPDPPAVDTDQAFTYRRGPWGGWVPGAPDGVDAIDGGPDPGGAKPPGEDETLPEEDETIPMKSSMLIVEPGAGLAPSDRVLVYDAREWCEAQLLGTVGSHVPFAPDGEDPEDPDPGWPPEGVPEGEPDLLMGMANLAPGDRPEVYVLVQDQAGNLSPGYADTPEKNPCYPHPYAVRVRDVMWTATMGGKEAGSDLDNPHQLVATSTWSESLVQPLGSELGEPVQPMGTAGAPRWSERSGEGVVPSARSGHVMVYDASRGVNVLFGGNDGAAGNHQDTRASDRET
ncbi:MAG: hypothetical protein VX938_13030, partial [Myxococcota bacterium]|nr:hypothetical protein [Myxococcota bacterium]